MQDAAGKWVTVNPDMGMPAGKPKTIAVPLHWLSASRKLRIVTDLCVYWDEIFLSETAAPPDARLQHPDGGFRRPALPRLLRVAHRSRPQTARHVLLQPGRARRLSGIPPPASIPDTAMSAALLNTVDDRFVIMGSGDEMTLALRRRPPPRPPAGPATIC